MTQAAFNLPCPSSAQAAFNLPSSALAPWCSGLRSGLLLRLLARSCAPSSLLAAIYSGPLMPSHVALAWSQAIAGLNRGALASEAEKADVDRLARQLEAEGRGESREEAGGAMVGLESPIAACCLRRG